MPAALAGTLSAFAAILATIALLAVTTVSPDFESGDAVIDARLNGEKIANVLISDRIDQNQKIIDIREDIRKKVEAKEWDTIVAPLFLDNIVIERSSIIQVFLTDKDDQETEIGRLWINRIKDIIPDDPK